MEASPIARRVPALGTSRLALRALARCLLGSMLVSSCSLSYTFDGFRVPDAEPAEDSPPDDKSPPLDSDLPDLAPSGPDAAPDTPEEPRLTPLDAANLDAAPIDRAPVDAPTIDRAPLDVPSLDAFDAGPDRPVDARVDVLAEASFCPVGQVRCEAGGACVSLDTPRFCGSCVTSCPTGVACVGGRCACGAEGDPCCAGEACSATTVCNAGTCVRCPAGYTACDGTCRETDWDRSHCGGCGVACGTAEVCAAGRCRSAAGCSMIIGTSCAATRCCGLPSRCEGAVPTCCVPPGGRCALSENCCAGSRCNTGGFCCRMTGQPCVSDAECCGRCVDFACTV